jgi:hypothetical protein
VSTEVDHRVTKATRSSGPGLLVRGEKRFPAGVFAQHSEPALTHLSTLVVGGVPQRMPRPSSCPYLLESVVSFYTPPSKPFLPARHPSSPVTRRTNRGWRRCRCPLRSSRYPCSRPSPRIVSPPVPPSMWSLPMPPINTSLPRSPKIKSLPEPPSILSPPASPWRTSLSPKPCIRSPKVADSLPPRPLMWFLPLVPLRVSG